MSSQVVHERRHPVAAFYDRLDARLDEVAELGLLTMTPEELRAAW